MSDTRGANKGTGATSAGGARRWRDALLGGVYLVVIAALIALSIAVFDHAFTDYTTVALHTDNVGSALQKGSDVKVRGVIVGSVDSITTDGDGAVVHLNLDPDKADSLPADLTAQLLPKTLFGERYVALQLPADPAAGPRLRSGDSISQDTSVKAVELQKVFDDLYPVLTAVQPDKLSASLGEIAAALRGNGADIADTMNTVGSYLAKFSPHTQQFVDDLGALATTAKTYASAGPDIADALDALSTTSATIVAQKADLASVLASVSAMSDTVRSFVSDSSDSIIGLSGSSRDSLAIAAKYAPEFPCLMRALVAYIPVGNAAFGAGTSQPGAHVQLKVVPRVAPYTTADLPTFEATAGYSCPYTPPTSLALTAVAGASDVPGAGATSDGRPLSDLGTVNSPQENQLIAELIAPTLGVTPKVVPAWSSFLLGPALRGTDVALTAGAAK